MVVVLEGFEGGIFIVGRPGGGIVRVLRLWISGGETMEGVYTLLLRMQILCLLHVLLVPDDQIHSVLQLRVGPSLETSRQELNSSREAEEEGSFRTRMSICTYRYPIGRCNGRKDILGNGLGLIGSFVENQCKVRMEIRRGEYAEYRRVSHRV